VPGEIEEWVPTGIDATVPSVARVYDFFLGGKDNFAADRALAEQVLQRVPETADALRANRRFLGRAVEFLATAGIGQFLDLGAGLPSQNNVHEVAQRANPGARVVYVDNDPVVLTHARALLAGGGSTVVVQGDVREPARILADPAVRQMIDFSRPVAVMCVALLHFVTDDEDPWGIVATLTGGLAPGSYLVLSHSTFDGHPAEVVAEVQARYRSASAPAVFRGREGIARFFDGSDLVDPGLVNPTDWRSDDEERARPGGEWMLAGVGRKR
jgi:O-methyltransferase involved in polyketide biosynthesis